MFRSLPVVTATGLVVLMLQAISFAQAPSADEFLLGVRTTEPLAPAEQATKFHLPPGFRIDLISAEPDIAKPMNLAFDTRGRLWVSSSLEYPFAAKDGTEPRDTIHILEDTDGDKRADKVTVFADKLNIPIGLLPYGDGVIAFAIPNIWYLRDTDGDDVCDVREVLYGPFDTTRDTHGMCNAFRLGEDGWVYACHGFNNQSNVAGTDGHRVQMSSGNTFRFRPDGSRIELYTQGQVNPFGMAIDRFGDIYTADCHTKPVTLLLPGGCYDSFGRPHDGLGYVPNVMEHLHGSTAIAALALGSDTTFPAEYADTTFDGNVMTSRVNMNRLERRGSSVKAIEQPDLVSCDDPWFRPVDLVPGPDGALYIADFYNRIIGHYEVDLLHPGRDRHRGRIWRVAYEPTVASVIPVKMGIQRSRVGNALDSRVRGNDDALDAFVLTGLPATGASGYGLDLTQLPADQLIQLLRTSSPVQRRLAEQVLDGIRSPGVTGFLVQLLEDDDPDIRRTSLRLLAQRGVLDAAYVTALSSDPDEIVRVHVMRTLRELPSAEFAAVKGTSLLQRAFSDDSPLVRRAAAAAASVHRKAALIAPLLRLLHTTELGDIHLRHAVRIALRDHLRDEAWFRDIASTAVLAMDRLVIADLSLALKTPVAAEYIASNIEFLGTTQPQRLGEYLQFASSSVPASAAENIVAAVRTRFGTDDRLQRELLESMRQGFASRNQHTPEAVRAWARELALQSLGMKSTDDLESLTMQPALGWTAVGHPDHGGLQDCWGLTQSRTASDNVAPMTLFSSFERGESLTGVYRSDAFQIGDSLRFFAAGHDGFPTAPLKVKNKILLRDAVTNEILRESPPPRNDVAQLIEWQTADLAGRRVVVELVDGDTASAYAWLAVGRFSDERLNPSDAQLRFSTAGKLIADFQLHELRPALVQLMQSVDASRAIKSSLVTSLVQLSPDARLSCAALIPSVVGCGDDVVSAALAVVADNQPDKIGAVLEAAFVAATSPEQQVLAEQLAADESGAAELTRLMEIGRASSRLLLRPSIRQRLDAVASNELKARIDVLVGQLPNEDTVVEELLRDRRTALQGQSGNHDSGRELFKKNCQTCHRLANEGKQVGPNLDGIGNRGLDRLLEDILAPNRNVDVAFRTTTIVTTAGVAYTGLMKELPDGQISLVDSQAKETLLRTDEIDERVPSSASPMPSNFGETLNEEQLRDLTAFLLQQRATPVH